MADNTRGGSQDGANPLIATDEVTHSGDTADVQLMRPVHVTGSEGAKTVVDLTNADGQMNVLLGNATSAATAAITAEGSLQSLLIGGASTNAAEVAGIGSEAALNVGGNVAHDATDSGNPVKIGGKANAAAPTDVSANNERVDAWFLRNGSQATTITAAGALIGGDATNGLDVDVTRISGDVTVVQASSTNLRAQVGGFAAHDALASGAGNPIYLGGFASAAAPADVSGDADIVHQWFLRNGAAATVVTAAGALIGGDATNGLDVDVTRVGGTVTVGGAAAHASPTSGNPVYIAGRASTAIPTDVGADGDAAGIWTNRSGAPVQTMAPHVGLNSDPWNLVHEGAQYTSTQTSTVLVAGGGSEKIVVTQCQIQAYGTTAFDLQVYFGTGAFSRGTNRTIFDGTFKPSSTLAPGWSGNGPFISGTNGDDILVTTSANGSVTISVWYYVVT